MHGQHTRNGGGVAAAATHLWTCGLSAHTGSVRSASEHVEWRLSDSSVKTPHVRCPVSDGYAVRPQRICLCSEHPVVGAVASVALAKTQRDASGSAPRIRT